jgi:hypothetical protein
VNKAHTPADIVAAVKNMTRFAGKSGSNRGPILVVVGSRPSEEVLVFQNHVLNTMDIGHRMRNRGTAAELDAYLRDDTHPDPIFYREGQAPSPQAQQIILDRARDPVKRHFLPSLLLVAITEHPSALASLSSNVLLPEFVELVGARIVDISPSASGTVPVWVQLKNLFLGTVSRRSQMRLEPEAADLIEHALKGNATISFEVVMDLAKKAKKSAEQKGLPAISRDLLWEVFPDYFREAVQPSAAAVQ